ncbi:MbtH family protein [Bacillus atrophaeus]|uniref:MbtH family protein n=1 Tax=Bacillus atrophaeus TaxID=1452 RepID=UPI002281752E|nr:MbtH family protein [Bacillus atrophaeus]MCY8808787.1 MbtH family protein [Bacillus atrophaeus]MCY8835707.1 MbtH family protein [Bacillus atrophaeus]MCY8916019.1 MbtH family protein [Bacillus atrophaeus]MCY8923939.1 MbtH family protein [Bacillus atrophaeus]MCY9106684.1 MbtH family protein [Bacillus atrophaeus]
MTNPFENADGTYFVLVNEEGQYSLWPGSIEVPNGWNVVYEQEGRQACLDYINSHWHNMQPNSLIPKAGIAEEK